MNRTHRQRGLTLIEILLALIVMTLGVVGILALFPAAYGSAKVSVEETNAAIQAESIAHALTNAVRFAEYNSTTNEWTVHFSHDLKALDDSPVGVYQFILPTLKDVAGAASENDRWRRHPAATAGTKGDLPTAQIDLTPIVWKLGGDTAVADAHKAAIGSHDKTDPYTQYGFCFDVRKINRLDYLLNVKKPGTNVNYTADDLETLVKLYEFRIHIFHVLPAAATGGGTTTSSGPRLRHVATVTSSVSTR